MAAFSTSYDKKEKLWYGRDIPPLYNPNISLAHALFNAMTTFGSKIAQISDNDGVHMTFDQIHLNTIRAAQNLQARGYGPKQTFTFVAGNSCNVASVVFASLAIGCSLHCPSYNKSEPSHSKAELIRLMNITKPVLLFCDTECYEVLNECVIEMGSKAKIFTFGGSQGRSEPVESLFEETYKEDQFVPTKVDGANETAMILSSSGTTGASKAECISHAAMLDGVDRFNVNTFNGILLNFSSLYWLSGVVFLFMGTLYGATRIITTQYFSPELQFRLIEKYKVTFLINPPHQLILMMKSGRFSKTDFSSIKHQFMGGSRVPLYLKTEFRRHLPNGSVHNAYGMSETASVMVVDYPETPDKDTVGKLRDGMCAKIIDTDGNRCGVDVVGEICLKMPYKYLGYHSNQKATDELYDGEGFIKTGDIGHFDEDGYLYIVDRKKDMLRYECIDMSPSDMEAHLITSKDIKLACVVGVPDAMGDLPAAAIIRTDGSNITEKEVCELIASKFADHCKLRGGVIFMDEFPTTPSGKVLRRKIMEKAIASYNARSA